MVGVFVGMAIANLSTYVVTALQLAIAHPDPVGGFGAAAAKFLGIFAVTQIPLALAEGVLGVLLFRGLESIANPELRALGFARTPAVKEAAHV